MIWSLTREQLRSQKRYTIATGIVIAITVGVAVYGALMAITVAKSALTFTHFVGEDRESEWVTTMPSDITLADLTARIDEANASGHEVVGRTEVSADLPKPSAWAWSTILAVYGDLDWSTMLVEGDAPGTGEIAVSAQWARDNGVAIGDQVRLEATLWDDLPRALPLESSLAVSGLVRSSVTQAGIDINVPDAYIAWEDALAIQEDSYVTYTNASDLPEAGEATRELGVAVGGNGAWAWDPAMQLEPGWDQNYGGVGSAKFLAILGAIGAGALVVGVVAMAFAMGRAQAHARARWVGTARALGITSRQIVWSTVLEFSLVGLGAGLLGYALGLGATAVHHGIVHADTAAPMLLGVSGLAWPTLAAALVLALALAFITAAIPAFWATRVEPVAALKPIADLSQAELSRRIKVWPLTIAWLVSLGILGLAAAFGATGLAAYVVAVAAFVVVVAGLMLIHEVLRRSLPWHAARLSQSRRRAVMVAGQAILARPRQFTVPAFITTLASGSLLGILASQIAVDAWETWEVLVTPGEATEMSPYVSPPIVVGVFALATIVCVAIGAATATLTAREEATRAALGLTPGESRAATAVQYLVAQLHGLALGTGIGLTVTAGNLGLFFRDVFSAADVWIWQVAALLGLVVAVGTVSALLGAAVVAAVRPRKLATEMSGASA